MNLVGTNPEYLRALGKHPEKIRTSPVGHLELMDAFNLTLFISQRSFTLVSCD